MHHATSSHSLNDDLLSAYLDGEVNDRDRRRVEAALESEPAAVEALNQLRYTTELLAHMPPVSIPRAFTLTEAQVQPQGRRRWTWPAWLGPLHLRGAAALIAVCLLVLFVGDLGFSAQLLPIGQPVPTAEVALGGLAPEDGDPTAIVGKTSTSEPGVTQADGFLGLSRGWILGLEAVLAVLLVLILIANWQLGRTVWRL